MQFYSTYALHRAMQLHGEQVAMVSGERTHTYAELGERVARLAAGLKGLGVEPGDRVGVLALNGDYYVELYLAIWWAGAVINPVNIRWCATEIASSLDDCDTRVLFFDPTFENLLDDIRAQSQSLRELIAIGQSEATREQHDYQGLINGHAPIEDTRRSGSDLAGVFYTGGTTGKPKGVMLSHDALMSNAYLSLLDISLDEHSVTLQNMPLFHLAGLSFMLRSLLRGSRMVLMSGFSIPAVLDCIAHQRVTHIFLVPAMLQMLIDDPLVGERDLSSVEFVGYGASPINEVVLERAFKIFPRAEFAQGYGMTEMAAVITCLSGYYHTTEGRKLGKLKSAGQPLNGLEVKIADEQGIEVARGSVGEILARGPSMMSGYWGREEETAAAIRDSWLHTGDMAWMDDDGFIFIVDRLKDMIVSGGENVYSSEVENALARHPAVASVAVIGIPSDKWGESVHAVVVLKPGAVSCDQELQQHCRGLIAGYKCPRSIEFRDALPFSAAGKLLKYQLRQPFWQGRTRQIA